MEAAMPTSDDQDGENSMPSVKLKDIANISVGDERQSISKTNGKDAVNVQVTKAQDANTVKVAKDTKKKLMNLPKTIKISKLLKLWILRNQ